MQTLQSDVATLKSGAIGDSSSQLPSSAATLLQTDRIVSGKDPVAKWQQSDEGRTPKKKPLAMTIKEDFTMSEARNALTETPFKSKMNTASRKKKMANLRL